MNHLDHLIHECHICHNTLLAYVTEFNKQSKPLCRECLNKLPLNEKLEIIKINGLPMDYSIRKY